MPNFTNRPPAEPRGPAFPLRRTPINKSLAAIITCDDLIGCPTHFFKGRTQPCSSPDCEACLEQIPWRWHGYVSSLNIVTHEHFIFEMTAQASDALVAYRDQHNTLRGCLFEAKRLHPRTNARVILRCKPADLQQINLPQPPKLEHALSILWNLPVPEIDLTAKPPYETATASRVKRDRVSGPKHVLDSVSTGGNTDPK